jgi:hypothetical protein
MQMQTVRIRVDRRTGKEIARAVVNTFDMPDDEYADNVVRAITGRSTAEAGRAIREELAHDPIRRASR